MTFTKEYRAFVESHLTRRSGPSRQRLAEGLGHAETMFLEKVWWPMFHQFENLHPEYEVRDYREGYRYIDFAYIEPYFRVAMEIDGIGPHWKNINKWQFTEHNFRQNSLAIDGWYILRFTYDAIDDHPIICQQTIQQLLGRWQSSNISLGDLTVEEREVARSALRATSPITPAEVALLLNTSPKTARWVLHRMVQKRWLVPSSGKVRYTSYQLHPSRSNMRL